MLQQLGEPWLSVHFGRRAHRKLSYKHYTPGVASRGVCLCHTCSSAANWRQAHLAAAHALAETKVDQPEVVHQALALLVRFHEAEILRLQVAVHKAARVHGVGEDKHRHRDAADVAIGKGAAATLVVEACVKLAALAELHAIFWLTSMFTIGATEQLPNHAALLQGNTGRWAQLTRVLQCWVVNSVSSVHCEMTQPIYRHTVKEKPPEAVTCKKPPC